MSPSTRLLAQSDAYLKAFEATAVAVRTEDRAVALDATAFYPGGGGQPADHGVLDGKRVEALKREGELVWHRLDGDPRAGGSPRNLCPVVAPNHAA